MMRPTSVDDQTEHVSAILIVQKPKYSKLYHVDSYCTANDGSGGSPTKMQIKILENGIVLLLYFFFLHSGEVFK